MKPGISLTDRRFKYTSSANTDIRKTFARIRRQQRQELGPPTQDPNLKRKQ